MSVSRSVSGSIAIRLLYQRTLCIFLVFRARVLGFLKADVVVWWRILDCPGALRVYGSTDIYICMGHGKRLLCHENLRRDTWILIHTQYCPGAYDNTREIRTIKVNLQDYLQ